MSPATPHLVDEILEEIFVCLSTPAALARASTACPRFRRIITDRSFLRRYRKRHPPPLLGFADRDGFHPAQAPHPSAPLARALAAAADFTYSFVPKPNNESWIPCNVRDGRVLLQSTGYDTSGKLAVCDPLSRRYVLLPPIPEDLAVQEERNFELRPILAPIAEDDEDKTSFKVICFAGYETKLAVFVFSSVTQQWRTAASPSWSSLGADNPWVLPNVYMSCGLSCFDLHLLLDTRTMEVSIVNDRIGYHMELRWMPGQAEEVSARDDVRGRLRPGQERSLPAIVVGREGAVEMFSLVGDHSLNGSFHLYHTTQDNDTASSKEWQLKNIIPLPGQYDYFTLGAVEGFLFLGATTEDQLDIDKDSPVWLTRTYWDVDYFSLEVQTSKLTKVCRRKRRFFHSEDVYRYFGFPPSLSKPSI